MTPAPPEPPNPPTRPPAPQPLADGACAIALHGERIDLLPERAAWWPAARTLFVADAHLGKAAVFRARGLPVPEATTGARPPTMLWSSAKWRSPCISTKSVKQSRT